MCIRDSRYVGETVTAVVTTVLQTSAGRMIFTRLKPAEDVYKRQIFSCPMICIIKLNRND